MSWKKENKIVVVLLLALVILVPTASWIGYQFAVSAGPISNPGITYGPGDADAYSYIVYVDSGTYYAKNATTRAIDYSSTNASYVLNTIGQITDGTIYIRAGTYTFTTSWIITPYLGERTIRGDGEQTQLVFTGVTNAIYLYPSGGDNFTIRDLRIVGSTNGVRTGAGGWNDVVIDSVWFGVSGVAVYPLTNCYRWVITNNHITSGSGYVVISGFNSYVANNYFSGLTGDAIEAQSGSVIYNNHFQDVAPSDDYHANIRVDETGDNMVIDSNIIAYSANPSHVTNGIVVSTESAATTVIQNVIISNNIITSTSNYTNLNGGIYLHAFTGPYRQNLRFINIVNNYIANFSSAIIGMGQNIVTKGNMIRNVDNGIWYGNVNQTGNLIIGNSIYGSSHASEYDGIILAFAEATIVADNFIDYFAIGINEAHTAYTSGNHNFITSNYIQNCTTAISVVGGTTNSTSNYTP